MFARKFKPKICMNIKNYAKHTVTVDVQSPKYLKSTKTKRFIKVPPAFYGGRHIVTMLPGHGIGPELMEVVKDIFSFVLAPVDFEVLSSDNVTHDDVRNKIMSIRRNGTCIKGNIEPFGLEGELYNSPNIAIRKKLDLHVSITVAKSYPIPTTRFKNLDLIVIRQNTEGEYTMIEHENKPGIVESMKVCTRANTERLAHWAFQYCLSHGRKKMTIIHKANIMKLADGLFMQAIKDVSNMYPTIKVDDMIVDNTSMQLVSKPHQFDVLITPNLYGLILSNALCGMIGSAGLISSINYGQGLALFETTTRNSGTSIVGKNKANPIAILNASIDLLLHLGHEKYAVLIQNAIQQTIKDQVTTPDIGGVFGTSDVVLNIKNHIAKGMIDNVKKSSKR